MKLKPGALTDFMKKVQEDPKLKEELLEKSKNHPLNVGYTSEIKYCIISVLSDSYGGGYDYLAYQLQDVFGHKETSKSLKPKVKSLLDDGLIRCSGGGFFLTPSGELFKRENNIPDNTLVE